DDDPLYGDGAPLFRRDFTAYGLALKGWPYHLNVGLLWALVVVAVGGLALALLPLHLDPLQPPDLPRASVFSCGWSVLTLLVALFLSRERGLVRGVPSTGSLLILIGLLWLPLVLAV